MLKEKEGRTFDCVLMNPPYQAPKEKEHEGRGKCGKSLWEAFVKKSFELCKNDGHVCNIHPSRWRKPQSEFGKELRKKQFLYLEMHNTADGNSTFGCNTDYDWYISKNCCSKKNTKIVDYNGNVVNIDISDVPFVPNANIKEVLRLVAKDGEEKVNLLWNCVYHTQAKAKDGTMSKEQNDEFKYPCVYTVCAKKTGLWYSNKREQFFGVPKVIWGNGLSKVIIDKDGQYGLTQFATGITDDVAILPLIQKALLSERFIKDIMGYTKGVGHIYDKNIIATFRKDFWKEFI